MAKKRAKKRNRTPAGPTLAWIHLGCPKNLIDSERMLAEAGLEGFVITGEPEGADVAVVNTCSFIDIAREEATAIIGELLSAKSAGRLGAVVVAGCLAQRYGARLLKELPGIDAVVGLGARGRIAEVCRRVLTGDAEPIVDVPPVGEMPADGTRVRLTPRHYAYLRISEGCDNRCSYCTIPDIRGPFRSKGPEEIIAEAEELVADGAREIILIGQDTTSYGRDIGGDWTLARLVARLEEVPGLVWLRLLYTHPASFGEDLIEAFAAGGRFVPYVDLPLQHVSERILGSMGRRVDRAGIERLIEGLRRRVEGLALRTSFIVGYPGETEAEFAELLEFVRREEFDRLGSFAYSAEEGTRAAALEGQLDAETKARRRDELMRLAAGISRRKNEALVGRQLVVVIDGPGAGPKGQAVARHAGLAPEIDGVVFVKGSEAEAGEFLTVRVAAADDYDIEAEAVDEPCGAQGAPAGKTVRGKS
ncbi:MAG: 30S ribosomal protein S12 methylthiotransferase RimO [Phycisphaerae bacterium]|nr:30S ribosomal protein S12 methylthiotransferase RimO [Phycisphaerae bacterium]